MGIEVTGIEELAVMLQQTGAKAQKGVSEQMKREAIKIRDLARKFAPVDYGNLEDAIQLGEDGGERDDFSGRFTRKSYTVFIDMEHPAEEGKVVGDYAYLMHEHLMPYGPFKLGEHSLAKQAGQTEMVGGMYLDRAVDQVTEGMMRRLIDVARTYL